MGEIVFVGFTSFTNPFQYLRAVSKCVLERYFLLAMFVSLYGTAPCYVACLARFPIRDKL